MLIRSFARFRSASLAELGALVAREMGINPSIKEYDTECVGVDMRRAHGLFRSGPRILHIRPDRYRALSAVLEGGTVTPDSVDALRTLAHELGHATSPMFMPGGDQRTEREAGMVFEEGIVELRARGFVARAIFDLESDLQIPEPYRTSFGSFPIETRAVRWLQNRIGENLVEAVWQATSGRARREIAGNAVMGWCRERLEQARNADVIIQMLLPLVSVRIADVLQEPDSTPPGVGTLHLDSLASDPPDFLAFREHVLKLLTP